MECNWSNPSWKMIEVKSKQEDYHSKLARDMYNFYHGSGNGVNAYGRKNYGNGNFTLIRHAGVGNLSSHAKSLGILLMMIMGVMTRYDYYEHSPYDCYEEYHHSYVDGNLFYHLLFKDILERMVFKEEGRKCGSLENFVSTFPHLNLEVLAFVKYKVYPSFPNALVFIGK
ncbi:hypothetical protein M9H77_06995 [Catharanthus roseus]|uniref:Uncharacterized protein n=1 Tax=Catharanthus roseus TaxID=4058 RepID=A0ACC0BTQ2_CATRO|nr:hypothetical protein M9H77_06995 [Catharanthus roseus]